MSNYSKTTNFASKDSLATGNPLKIIKGTEIDDEFNAIETAMATKLDENSISSSLTTGSVTTTSVYFGGNTSGWKVTQSGTDLIFSYNGTDKAKLETSGDMTVIGSVTAGGTI